MRAEVHDDYTNIYLEKDEVRSYCRPGSADTCIWLICASKGFECAAMNKPLELVLRFDRGETNAKRNGEKENCPIPQAARRELRGA